MPALHILAEARSYDPVFRRKIIDTWKEAFETAASSVSNIHNQHGSVAFGPGPTYEAFALADDAPVVEAVKRAAKQIDLPIQLVSNSGGMDANWIVAHGIPCVTLCVGQREVHSPNEWIDLTDFESTAKLVIAIATERS